MFSRVFSGVVSSAFSSVLSSVLSRVLSGVFPLVCHVMSLFLRAGYSLDKSPAHRRAPTDEQCGVQYLAQRHLNMQLSPAQSRDLNQ